MIDATVVDDTLAQDIALATSVPIELLESLLQEYLADPRATIGACTCTPFSHLGTNDSSAIYRVALSWESRIPSGRSHSPRPNEATWIVKHWKAGGVRDSALGILQSREALAWEAGWLHRSALPAGVVVPIVGTRRSPDNSEAWVAMEDVSTDLSAYQRISLTGEQTISQTQAILAQLARFHALWEEAERQPQLEAATWLRRPQTFLWDLAHTYAGALGRSPIAQAPLYASAPPVWSGLNADLEAFLEAQPGDERRVWEHLMIDRRDLVAGLAGYPQTLLHSDLDDRNIGLRWRNGGAATNSPALDTPDLVLIDWEWIARGPAAVDVANLLVKLPIMLSPSAPFPKALRTNDLADDYFKHYRAAGGRCLDLASWRRSYGLAYIAQGVAQIPFTCGSFRRSIGGEKPLPEMIGVPEAVVRQKLEALLPVLEWMEQQLIDEVHSYLD